MASVDSGPPVPSQATSHHTPRPRRNWRKPQRSHDQVPAPHDNRHDLRNTQTQEEGQDNNQPRGVALLASIPAPIIPLSEPSSQDLSSTETSSGETGIPRGTSGRGMRGQERGGNYFGQGHEGKSRGSVEEGVSGYIPQNQGLHPSTRRGMMTGPGRQFGGRLTTEPEANTTSRLTSSLQADAPEFRPGRPHAHRPAPGKAGKPPPPAQRHMQGRGAILRRGSSLKSTAPDIPTRTHEDIANGLYECPICTSEIGRNSRIWSCKTCWTVFHLTCIKKWSTNEGSTLAPQQTQNGDVPPPRQWRCPGCNLPKDVLPSSYTCWCEKEVDPRAISGLPPHSCGQTCGKHRGLPRKCPHPCELPCHAGPCPPCTHVGPVQSCFCGKLVTSRRCLDTNYDAGWSCGNNCGDPMPCGEHMCQKPCHEGLCGACDVEIDSRCYCGKVERPILCCERGDQKGSRDFHDEHGVKIRDEWIGMFECGTICQRSYDCGKHECERLCHPQELESSHCPRSPDIVSSCPCGKTLLAEISDKVRQSCTDPIPNCEKECSKKLQCGHRCRQTCHYGTCPPCAMIVAVACRCGRTTSDTICHTGKEEPPQCMRTCKASLNCGRHECGQQCCSGERRAAERQATKRKLRPLGASSRVLDEGFEAEHICTRVCGRTLKCGNHACPELCHRGPCGSCREAVFDEISCHCGRTVLQPPLPCGTTSPPCRFDCGRPTRCGHPRVPHNCHGEQEQCPKCPFLKEKPCMCGKKTLQNQPCWLVDVRCGEVCGRKLKCGSHFCRKPCHRLGECEDAGTHCHQACGKAKRACGHPCEEQCHAPSFCREEKACQNKMFITCECQHLKQETKCNASKTSEGNSKKSLNCDDECARLARNRKLALALNIDPEEHKDEHIPYAMDTLYMFQEGVKWAQIQEREFRVFAADEAEKRLRFKPMPPHQRAFIHSLADDFGFDSESMDPEPHRHVAIFKTPRFVMAPMKTLAECVRIRTSAEASSTTIAEAQKKLNAHNEPYNGFLLTGPRFGLTLEDLRADLSSTLKSSPSLVIDISFLPSEEIVLKAHSISASTTTPSPSIEAILRAMKPALSATILSNHLAVSIQLCALDSSLNILRRELSEINANGGWSHVAAKGAAPRQAPKLMAVGEKSVYTVLGSKMRDAKRKEKEERKREREAVVDDWEEEARKEEAEEEEKWGGVGKGVEVESQRVEADGELAEDYDPENKVMNEDTTARDEGSTTTAKDEATEPLHHKSELPTSTTNKDADAIDVSNQSALPRPPQ